MCHIHFKKSASICIHHNFGFIHEAKKDLSKQCNYPSDQG